MILGPRIVSIGANGLARMQVTWEKLPPIGYAGSVEFAARGQAGFLKLGTKTFTVEKERKGYASMKKLSLKSLKLLREEQDDRGEGDRDRQDEREVMKVSPGTITLKARRRRR